jgi:hypothetical protein
MVLVLLVLLQGVRGPCSIGGGRPRSPWSDHGETGPMGTLGLPPLAAVLLIRVASLAVICPGELRAA